MEKNVVTVQLAFIPHSLFHNHFSPFISNCIQLFQKMLSEEKQKAFKPRPKGNMGLLEWLAIGPRDLTAT